MLIEEQTATIVVARISLLRPIREDAPRLPHFLSLVVANGFGCEFAIFDRGFQEGAVVSPCVIDYCGKRTSAAEMRHYILKHIGDNNILVWFHLAWTLTALSLALPACRVVDHGA